MLACRSKRAGLKKSMSTNVVRPVSTFSATNPSIFLDIDRDKAQILGVQLSSVFQALQAEGIAILFIEQNVRLALSMAGRGYILESGHLAIEGDAPTLINSPEVRRIFLGG